MTHRRTKTRALIGAGVSGLLLLASPGLCEAADSPPGYAAGKDIFASHCASCHQANGSGVPGSFPPLAGNEAIQHTEYAVAVVLQGMNAEILAKGETYHNQMPAWGDQLSDTQIAQVLTYVRNSWGNAHGPVKPETVAQLRAEGAQPQALMPAVARPGGKDDETKPKGDSSEAYAGRVLDFDAIGKLLGKMRFRAPAPAETEALPGAFGEMVRLGYQIFTDTQRYASKYVGNGLNCRNCHLNAGALADSAPLWGAVANFPHYRSKNHLVNSFQNRVQGCFLYSENGVAPPAGGAVLTALEAYSFWLARGAPIGIEDMAGRGYGEIEKREPDPEHGAALYAERCAICHGDRGQGTPVRNGDGYQFPPLWGPDSYNWGAGMHRASHFAAFIKHNMPLGQPGTLTDQEAWDIAAWVNGEHHHRPTRIHNPGQAPLF